MIHGAYNELWGPNELAARWIPALQDGLWHAGRTIDPAEVSVCFYGDLFRRDPEQGDSETWDDTKAGVEDALTGALGENALSALTELAGRQTYERTVDMFASLATDPSLASRVRERLMTCCTTPTCLWRTLSARSSRMRCSSPIPSSVSARWSRSARRSARPRSWLRASGLAAPAAGSTSWR